MLPSGTPLFILTKAQSEAFIFSLKVSSYSSHVSFFKAVGAFLHQRFVAICVMAAFHLLQVFSGWRLLLPLTLYSRLPFLIGQLSKFLCLRSFTGQMFPHPAQIWLFPHHSPRSSSTNAFFSTTCLHLTFVSGSSPFACKCLLKRI